MADLINKWDVVSKLIDLENEFQHYKPFHGFEHAMYRKICELEIAIGKTPPADAVEVVHGRWSDPYMVVEEYDIWGRDCSVCGCTYGMAKTNYCPNCGAKMDGDGNA